MRKILLTGAALLAGGLTVPAAADDVRLRPIGAGRASWYHEGARVACGSARYDPDGLTAAHRTLPCGSVVRVTNTRNGRMIPVRITDRGPAKWTGRVIDLSRGAAHRLDMIEAGVVPVTLTLEDRTP